MIIGLKWYICRVICRICRNKFLIFSYAVFVLIKGRTYSGWNGDCRDKVKENNCIGLSEDTIIAEYCSFLICDTHFYILLIYIYNNPNIKQRTTSINFLQELQIIYRNLPSFKPYCWSFNLARNLRLTNRMIKDIEWSLDWFVLWKDKRSWAKWRNFHIRN